ncbi:MAG TPA: hypothetical protein VEH57_03565, partial [Thermoplasmata archaeon]|nr:hypothetical protein [Thermoplasmata archaeon]
MSSTTALLVLVVIVIIAGAGAYGGFSSVPSTTKQVKSCEPIKSPACVTSTNTTNDVTMTIPFTIGYGQTYAEISVGTSLQASVGVTGSETIKSFSVTWGPGIVTTGSTGAQTYTYGTPGLYTLVANATDTKGVVHNGPGNLVPLLVTPSSGSITNGYFPRLSTTLTNSSGGDYGWIGAGGTISVNASYAAPPANALWSTKAPSLTATGGSQSSPKSGATYAGATYTFATPGYYGITFVGPSTDGTQTLYQNFTWGVYVGQTASGLGCVLCKVSGQASPHKNYLYNYEVIPGGALSLDPAADYYSVGYEVGEAFDETLISFNGTDSGPTWN